MAQLQVRQPTPLLITESLCAPMTARRLLAEACFECFQAPSAWMGADALLGGDVGAGGNKLLVHLGNFASHVVPIVNGRPIFSQARRCDVGGRCCLRELRISLSLRYPQHRSAMDTDGRMEQIRDACCRVAEPSYSASVPTLQAEYYQFPFSLPPQPTATDFATLRNRREQNAERLRLLLQARRATPAPAAPQGQGGTRANTDRWNDRLRDLETALAAETGQAQVDLLCAFRLEVINAVAQEPPAPPAGPRRNLDRLRLLSLHGDANEKDDVGFGADDDDWLVYKEMNLEPGIVPTHQEELRRLDFLLGWAEKQLDARLPPPDWLQRHSDRHRIALESEQIRPAEVLFQPTAFLGLDQSGLSETVESVAMAFPPQLRQSLRDNVVVTGGGAGWRGLPERLRTDLQLHSSVEAPVPLPQVSSSPSLDPFYGTIRALQRGYLPFLRAEYEERGFSNFVALQHTALPFSNPPA